ncbi:MAG: DUF4405 domain-containing protein [Deltaproteobacteria bacterium]|nr:DUF4405 domain-containing protein [Deltaproteobacteria bacterium]
MKKEDQRNFNIRAFVAIVAVISVCGLSLSGIANHILHNDPITFPRHAWMAAHWLLGIIFVFFAVLHAMLNRRALIKHIKGVFSGFPVFSRELILAGAMLSAPFLLSIIHGFIAD